MERNTVVCADALDWLRSLEDGSVDVFWSSPPYNLADPFRSGGNQSRKRRPRFTYAEGGSGDGAEQEEEAYQDGQAAVLREWHRVLRDDGVAFYNHKVRQKDGAAIHPLDWIRRTPFVLSQEVVWNRRGTPNVDTRRFLPVSERVYVLTKRPDVHLDNPLRYGDVFDVPRMLHRRADSGHPCPTNPEVVRRCLSVVAKPKSGRLVVADCYGGTGTTALVARSLGMDYLLCDHTEQYVALAQRNLEGPTQPLLFEAAG